MKITPILIKGTDVRGYTAEYMHERSGNQLLSFRKAGTSGGRHYHKGISANKNPEVYIVVYGDCILNWKHIDDTEIQSCELSGPVRLDIPPLIWHEVISVTDCVFLEMNSIDEHVADLFFLDK